MAEKKKLTAKEQKIVAKKASGFDSNTKGVGLPQKSSKATVKAVVAKKSVKATAKERGFAKDKASRKEMKQQDVFYNKAGKKDLKSGQVTGASKANVSKSQSPSKPKVPVKPRGGRPGLRGFGGGGGGGLFGTKNR
jgi:hypothetical protein